MIRPITSALRIIATRAWSYPGFIHASLLLAITLGVELRYAVAIYAAAIYARSRN